MKITQSHYTCDVYLPLPATYKNDAKNNDSKTGWGEGGGDKRQ